MQTFLQDLRYGLRMLAKAPGFTTIIVLTLALGIGANTAIFSVVNAVLLKPLPYRNPGQLVWISESIPMLHANLVASPDYLDWREQSQTMADLAAYSGENNYNLTGNGEPERIEGVRVSANFLPMLGVQPEQGRFFTAEEDRPRASRVVLLMQELWRRRFGGDPRVLNQTLPLSGEDYTVIGILPASFQFPQAPHAEVLLPLALDPVEARSGGRVLIVRVVGRLKSNIQIAQARSELQTILDRAQPLFAPGAPPAHATSVPLSAPANPAPPGAAAPAAMTRPFQNSGPGAPGPMLAMSRGGSNQPVAGPSDVVGARPSPEPRRGGGGATYRVPPIGGPTPADRPPDRKVVAMPLQERLVGNVRTALMILLGAVGFVLVIACANVANLLLARAPSRHREMVIRATVGAGRWRIVRQLLTESIVLSVAGGAVGLALAVWSVRILVGQVPRGLSGDALRATGIGIDLRVLAFTVAVSVVTGILFGFVPAVGASRPDLEESLKEGAHSATTSRRRHRVRSVLVASELALALVLLIGAGLLIRSFRALISVDPGFQPGRVLAFSLNLTGSRYAQPQARAAFYDQLQTQLRALPGVESTAITDSLPLTGFTTMLLGLQVEGRPPAMPGQDPVISQVVVSPEFFHVLGMTLVDGRAFNDHDAEHAERVAIINQNLARHFFPNQNAVGKRLKFGPSGDQWTTIVGEVGDVRHGGLDTDAGPEIYVPMAQLEAREFAYVAMRTHGDPGLLAPAVRSEVGAIDKDQPIYDLETLDQKLATSLAARRFNMLLLGLFATLALALAAVGIYSVTSFTVTQRTHEIGVRMALGATGRNVIKMVVGETLLMTLVGIGGGLVAAAALSRLLASMLFGIHATDPATFAGVSLLLAAVALMATYVPARRATEVDPLVALRYE